jgi:hypothetical protein
LKNQEDTKRVRVGIGDEQNRAKNKGCVTLCGLAVYIKYYLKGKRRSMETQIFHHAKI